MGSRVEEWNAARERSVPKPSINSQNGNATHPVVATVNWLSLVCFVEDIDPETLGLEPSKAKQLAQEVATLRDNEDRLAVYAAAVEHLSQSS